MIEFSQAAQDTLRTAAPDTLPEPLKQLYDMIELLPEQGIYISASVGILIYVIGWFGGGVRKSMRKFLGALILIMIISIFSLPIPAYLFRLLLPLLGISTAFFVVYLAWLFFLLGMVLSLYETFIITADEAYHPGR